MPLNFKKLFLLKCRVDEIITIIFQTATKSVMPKKVDTVSIVIPARDEEGSILDTLDAIKQAFDLTAFGLDLVVVNDGSRDSTAQCVRDWAAQHGQARCVDNPSPHGFGYAIRFGLKHIQGDMAVIVMADGSDSPDDMVSYAKKIDEGYDCCFGTRWQEKNLVINYPFMKRILNRLTNHFIRIMFRMDYDDTTNAFKAYRKEVIDALEPITSKHFDITIELPLKSIVKGYCFAVIPTRWTQRTSGQSKLRLLKMSKLYWQALTPLLKQRSQQLKLSRNNA